MIERFLKQTHFTSEQDFKEHLEFICLFLISLDTFLFYNLSQ